jgi:hypothetical protein
MPNKDMATIPDAAELSGYNREYIRRIARSGQIKARQIGPTWLVSLPDLMKRKAAGMTATRLQTMRKRGVTTRGRKA